MAINERMFKVISETGNIIVAQPRYDSYIKLWSLMINLGVVENFQGNWVPTGDPTNYVVELPIPTQVLVTLKTDEGVSIDVPALRCALTVGLMVSTLDGYNVQLCPTVIKEYVKRLRSKKGLKVQKEIVVNGMEYHISNTTISLAISGLNKMLMKRHSEKVTIDLIGEIDARNSVSKTRGFWCGEVTDETEVSYFTYRHKKLKLMFRGPKSTFGITMPESSAFEVHYFKEIKKEIKVYKKHIYTEEVKDLFELEKVSNRFCNTIMVDIKSQSFAYVPTWYLHAYQYRSAARAVLTIGGRDALDTYFKCVTEKAISVDDAARSFTCPDDMLEDGEEIVLKVYDSTQEDDLED